MITLTIVIHFLMPPRRPKSESSDDTDRANQTEFEWVSLESAKYGSGSIPKVESIVVLFVIATLALALGASGGVYAHTNFTASNVATQSNGGQLTSLTVAPTGDIHYDGLEAAPSSVDIEINVRKSGGSWETIGTTSTSATGQQGSVNFSFSQIDILSSSSLSPSDFQAPTDGGSQTTTLEIQVVATLVGVDDGGADITTSAMDSYDVTVNNQPVGGNVGGEANTGGS